MARRCEAAAGPQPVGAINAGSGRTLGVEPVADKSNEIPAGGKLSWTGWTWTGPSR